MSLGRVSIPSNASFYQTARVLNDLVRKMKPVAEFTKEVAPLKDSLTDVRQRAKRIKSTVVTAEKTAKKVEEVKKTADKAKQITDWLKEGKYKQVNPRFGQWMNIGLSLINLGLTTFLIKSNEEIQAVQFRKEDVQRQSLDLSFRLLIKSATRVQTLEKLLKKTNETLDRSIRTVYQDVQSAFRNSVTAREKANDALY
jgi:hypothetical protein